MHLFLAAEDGEPHLRAELLRTYPEFPLQLGSDQPSTPTAAGTTNPRRWLTAQGFPSYPTRHLAFARQCLPAPRSVSAPSIREWANLLLETILPVLPEGQLWRLHVFPHFGEGTAGQHRCELIASTLEDLLQRRRRRLRRDLTAGSSPFDPRTSLVQLMLTGPDHGFLAVSLAPVPHALRFVLSAFASGEIPPASDKAAPSRAFAKLVEAEQRLGRAIAPGESCVDLGASPGSWSYVALRRGATVQAVDRSPLREDLMRDRNLVFHPGDAFKFSPDSRIDWLLCDVIAAPERSIDLVVDWANRRLCRRFIVTIKFKGDAEYSILDRLKHELPPHCHDFFLTRLTANKNEVCVMGEVRD